MNFLYLSITLMALYLVLRSSEQCTDGVRQVRDAVMSVRESDPAPASALSGKYKLFGAAWCRYTKDMYLKLRGEKEWSDEVKEAFKKDPNVVDCDGEVENPTFKKVCSQTGYPTVLIADSAGKITDKGGNEVSDVEKFLQDGTDETGVWLGYDESKVDTFRPSAK